MAYISGLLLHSLHFYFHSNHMERIELDWEEVLEEVTEASPWFDWVGLEYLYPWIVLLMSNRQVADASFLPLQ